MDKKHFVSKGLGACKNSGSSSLLSFVSLHGGPELGFLNEGMSAGGETLRAVSKTKTQSPLKEWLWVREQMLSPSSFKMQSLSVAEVLPFYTRSGYKARIQLWDLTFT